MTEAHNIYDEFLKLEPDDYIGIRKFHQNNNLILDNITVFNDKEDFLFHLTILAQSVIGIEKAGNNKKAISYANKYLKFIESKIDKFGIIQVDCSQYWSIMVSKGRALYYNGDYKKSVEAFKQLLTWDPENDNYREWIDASKSILRNSINNYLYILALMLIIISIFFGDQIGTPGIITFMKGLGFIIFTIAIINEFMVGKVLKMIRKKINYWYQ